MGKVKVLQSEKNIFISFIIKEKKVREISKSSGFHLFRSFVLFLL